MKAYEIIGYAVNGALYHEGCEPEGTPEEDKGPIFASSEIPPDSHCDKCLSAWIRDNPGKSVRAEGAWHVFLDEWAAQSAADE